MVKTGATGKSIAEAIGRSVVALYQKASTEGISFPGGHPKSPSDGHFKIPQLSA